MLAKVHAAGLLLLAFAACGEINSDDRDAGSFLREDGAVVAGPDSGMQSSGILVEAVFDGDTIRVRANASVRAPDGTAVDDSSVRLLGIDAPEIAHPPATPDAECWGDQSATAARQLLSGKFITLEYDPSHDIRDEFGRILAYVHLPDDRVVNEVLVGQGHARSFRAFPHRDLSEYNQLEAQAKAQNLGMWTCP